MKATILIMIMLNLLFIIDISNTKQYRRTKIIRKIRTDYKTTLKTKKTKRHIIPNSISENLARELLDKAPDVVDPEHEEWKKNRKQYNLIN
jgi:hypothetical protein